jgi:hypothetical protein
MHSNGSWEPAPSAGEESKAALPLSLEKERHITDCGLSAVAVGKNKFIFTLHHCGLESTTN